MKKTSLFDTTTLVPYGFDNGSSGSEHNRASPMPFNVKVYQITDIYVVPQLKQKAKEEFETIVQTCWQMDDFLVAIAEAYK
jgi:speckle-type POZ protein